MTLEQEVKETNNQIGASFWPTVFKLLTIFARKLDQIHEDIKSK